MRNVVRFYLWQSFYYFYSDTEITKDLLQIFYGYFPDCLHPPGESVHHVHFLLEHGCPRSLPKTRLGCRSSSKLQTWLEHITSRASFSVPLPLPSISPLFTFMSRFLISKCPFLLDI